MNKQKSKYYWLAALLCTCTAKVAAEQSQFDCVINPRSVVEVGSAEEGILKEVLVDRGDVVKKGAVIARLDSEIQSLAVETARIQAERSDELAASRARLKFRKTEAERTRGMRKQKLVSEKIHDEAVVEQRLAEFGVLSAKSNHQAAQVELRRAKARLYRRTIRSSVDGVVVAVDQSPGEYIHEQSSIMTIAQTDPLHVEVFAPTAYYGSIEIGMQAEVMPEAPISGSYQANVTVVDRVLDSASGSFGVRLVLPNPEYILPAGLKCKIYFDGLAQINSTEEYLVERKSPAVQSQVQIEQAVVINSSAESQAYVREDDLVYRIQLKLIESGFKLGFPDGTLGAKTREAIKAYQSQNGLTVDGQATHELLDRLEQSS